jgi:hypothetical protein
MFQNECTYPQASLCTSPVTSLTHLVMSFKALRVTHKLYTTRRYDDQRGPVALVIILIIVLAVAYALSITAAAAPRV